MKSDGGPAFPFPSRTLVDPYDHGITERLRDENIGMSLRDYFAAKLIASMVPSIAYLTHEKGEVDAQFAARAYEMADAMLKAREVTP